MHATDTQSEAARAGVNVRFDDPSRVSVADQPVPLGGLPRALREAAESCGIDPISGLYNESLRYASEGHYRLSRERLQMLLCMKPDDGDARLLLAKVHVAGQRWKDALTALDEAQQSGTAVPAELRARIEEHQRQEDLTGESQRDAVRMRELGEIKALRQEARRLRSENAQLVGETSQLERDTRKWAWMTAGVSTVAMLFIVSSLVSGMFGGADVPVAEGMDAVVSEPAQAAQAVAGVEAADPAAAGAARPAAVPSDATSVASRAAQALTVAKGLEGTSLEVTVRSGKALVTGSVLSMQQRKDAETALVAVQGIDTVDLNGIQVLARTQGTTHVVRKGETLGHIALHYYGDSLLAGRIAKANKGLKMLNIGQEINIPAVD